MLWVASIFRTICRKISKQDCRYWKMNIRNRFQKWNKEIECLLEQINSTKLELEKDIRQQKECFIKEKEKLVFDHKHEKKVNHLNVAAFLFGP